MFTRFFTIQYIKPLSHVHVQVSLHVYLYGTKLLYYL